MSQPEPTAQPSANSADGFIRAYANVSEEKPGDTFLSMLEPTLSALHHDPSWNEPIFDGPEDRLSAVVCWSADDGVILSTPKTPVYGRTIVERRALSHNRSGPTLKSPSAKAYKSLLRPYMPRTSNLTDYDLSAGKRYREADSWSKASNLHEYAQKLSSNAPKYSPSDNPSEIKDSILELRGPWGTLYTIATDLEKDNQQLRFPENIREMLGDKIESERWTFF